MDNARYFYRDTLVPVVLQKAFLYRDANVPSCCLDTRHEAIFSCYIPAYAQEAYLAVFGTLIINSLLNNNS